MQLLNNAGKLEVLFSKFYRKTNLEAFMLGSLRYIGRVLMLYRYKMIFFFKLQMLYS
jgi:hypothetical protein